MTEPDLLNQAISDAYDETPYTSNALSQTAPGHLRAVAHLYGLDSAPLARARVLELGCAAGGNLIPFAIAHPDAEVIGIDLSPEQINAGREVAERLGLRNLDLRALSITDIDDSLGKFDYIICHGVFSWVPPVVREAILRVCRDNLAPEGLAFISYNVYPGWKTSDILRDAMQLNSFSAATPAEKLKKAKEMLGLLQHGLSPNNLMREAISKAAQALSQQPDHYLFHEYLEMINSPCYFLEFVASIQQAGLAYVSDVQPEGSFPSNYGEATATAVAAMSGDADRVMREQYLDFAVGRPFRQSVLVHAERADQILERPEASQFSSMLISTQLQPQTERDRAHPSHRHFRTPANTGLATQDPSLIALIEVLLQQWPAPIPFDQAVEIVGSKSELAGEALQHATMLHLITLLNCGALRYRRETVAYGNDSAKPRLIPGARELIIAASEKTLQVGHYNLWHQVVNLSADPATRYVATLLDGSLSQTEVRTQLRDALTSGRISHPDGLALKGARNVDPVAQELLVRILAAMRSGGLLL
ncbi:methyltransferase regulatory domain-containing protein [Achromobacter xylosoxidans]|uniref:methyltransferase regulatory domain-containing protein n=1 Tax=Alcaligenes xylosoxydans xylosoxydans TaxID=85698 RepID=UPI0022B8FC8E|nr:class I SAM-dependent methyltransferase [Achromobacter xylosoxidans]MCZ8393725.1 class I SAM-dependent methyltransferase [Achromobacter xylosoxidans]